MTTRQVPIGALTFDVRQEGPADGEPVVLLHGFPQTGAAWADVVPGLTAGGCRTIAMTQRGYAPSASPPDVADYSMAHLVGDVIGLLDALDLPDAHVVGHDWGGAVAWQLAARHPDRLRTVAVLCTPHPKALGHALRRSPSAQLRFSYAALLRLPLSEQVLGAADGLLIRRAMALSGLPDGADIVTDPTRLRTALHWYRAFTGAALQGLPRITVPVRFLFGPKDPVFTVAAARASLRWCDGPADYVEVPGGGHWLAHRNADLVVQELLGHVAAHGG